MRQLVTVAMALPLMAVTLLTLVVTSAVEVLLLFLLLVETAGKSLGFEVSLCCLSIVICTTIGYGWVSSLSFFPF